MSLGRAVVEVGADASGFERTLNKEVTRAGQTAAKTAGRGGTAAGSAYAGGFGKGVKKLVGITAGFFAVSKVSGFLRDVNAEARESQKVGALTTQVIKSTGGAANVTAKEVGDLATSISSKVAVDDEAIQSGENLLLTFKNIRNETGKGNKIFDQATRAAVDLGAGLAAASGGQIDFRSASTLVGKALNDPIRGITALQRVGVTFTEKQKKQIKSLVETGDAMGAQKIILKELKSEFGGAAKSQATAADRARVGWKNLEEQIGTALLPVFDRASTLLSTKVIPAVSDFVTGMQEGTGAGGDTVDVLRDLVGIGQGVFQFFDSLPGPVKKYGTELLIASVALSKINGLFLSGRAGITGWLTAMRPVEGQLTRTNTAAYKVGVGLRNLAGAGGMLAVVDGSSRMSKATDESGRALGALETVGGAAAAGFSVGGPWGAAVGTIGGFALAMKQSLKVTDAQMASTEGNIASMKDYVGALDATTAAVTRQTRSKIYDRLESSGLLAQTQALGIADNVAVKAVLGNEGARRKLTTAIDAQTTAHQKNIALNVAQKLLGEGRAIDATRLAQLQKNVAIAKTKDEVKKAQAALDKFAASHASPSITVTGVGTAIKELNAVLTLIREVTGAKGKASVGAPGSFSDLYPTGKASGGRVAAHTPYVVGETRPELFIPDTSGRIVPRVPSLLPSQTYGSTGSSSYDQSRSASLTIVNPVPQTIEKSAPRALAALQFVMGS